MRPARTYIRCSSNILKIQYEIHFRKVNKCVETRTDHVDINMKQETRDLVTGQDGMTLSQALAKIYLQGLLVAGISKSRRAVINQLLREKSSSQSQFQSTPCAARELETSCRLDLAHHNPLFDLPGDLKLFAIAMAIVPPANRRRRHRP